MRLTKGHRLSRTAGFVAIALAFTAPPARAGCAWSDVVQDETRASTVKAGAPRTYFVEDDVIKKGCPNQSPSCRARAYLTDGDAVMTGRSEGAFTCVGFTSARGTLTIGWLPNVTLVPLPAESAAATDFVGHWVGSEQDVTIKTASGESFAVEGNATWGMSDARRRAQGSIHTGEILGTARPEQGVLAFTMGMDDKTLPYTAGAPDECRVRMQRRGPYLVVRDNNACGGANVTFTGIYARKD